MRNRDAQNLSSTLYLTGELNRAKEEERGGRVGEMLLWGLQFGVCLFQGRLWSNVQPPQGMCHRDIGCVV